MTQQHPITPSSKLAAEWVAEIYGDPAIPLHPITLQLVERAARWGADQELEACCEWLFKDPATHDLVGRETRYLDFELRAARRPKPLSLKERAQRGLAKMIENGHLSPDLAAEIRAVVEMAPDA
jgi:hypothetical protein